MRKEWQLLHPSNFAKRDCFTKIFYIFGRRGRVVQVPEDFLCDFCVLDSQEGLSARAGGDRTRGSSFKLAENC